MGRPSTYTPEIADAICDHVADGSNLLRICQSEDFPNRDTIYKWLKDFPEFADNYAHARDLRADARFDKIDQVVLDMRDGKIDSQMARVEIDALKWQAGKEAPKRYGERLELASDPKSPLIPGKVLIELVKVDPPSNG